MEDNDEFNNFLNISATTEDSGLIDSVKPTEKFIDHIIVEIERSVKILGEHEFEQQDYDVIVVVVMATMSTLSIILNLFVARTSQKMKIFGLFFRFLVIMRSVLEALASSVYLAFFSPYVLAAFKAPDWVHSALAALFTALLSAAYVCHLGFSANRSFAIFFPMKYDEVFEKKRAVVEVAVVTTVIAGIVTSIPFYYPCSNFVFSRFRYDLKPLGCDPEKDIEYKSLLYLVIYSWGSCTFAALTLDLLSLVKLVRLSLKQKTRNATARNVRMFLQTFVLNFVVCAGVMANHLGRKDDDDESFVRFWSAHFQVLLGFIINGFIPIMFNKEMRPCVKRAAVGPQPRMLSRQTLPAGSSCHITPV